MIKKIFWTILAVIIVAASMTTQAAPASASYYEGEELDLSPLEVGDGGTCAQAINEQGQITGSYGAADGFGHGFLWDHGTAIDIGNMGGSNVTPLGINNRGDIVGQGMTSTSIENHAFVRRDGTMTDLGTLPGGNASAAYGINSTGQIVGYSQAANLEAHAILWEDGEMIDLGPAGVDSEAVSINNGGQILGNIAGVPVIWEHGTVRYLESPLGGVTRINNRGDVVGFSYSIHAQLWHEGIVTALPELDYFDYSQAVAINEYGQIAGNAGGEDEIGSFAHAVIWKNERIFDLHTVSEGIVNSTAYDINNRGWVVGCIEKVDSFMPTAFVWYP